MGKAERDNVAEDKTIACDIYGKEFGYLALEKCLYKTVSRESLYREVTSVTVQLHENAFRLFSIVCVVTTYQIILLCYV